MSGRRLGGFCMDHWDDFVDDEIGEQMHVITRKEELRQVELISVCRKLWIPWHRNCRAPPQIYY